MKKNWNFFRTLTLIIVGLLNTVFIRPEDIGSWKNYLGYLLLILAAVDIAVLIWKKLKKSPESGTE
jgi:uncharacterized membrane protein YfhO